MRLTLLILISAVLIPLGIFKPLYGLYGYIWFALMRPDALAWSVGAFPYSLLYAVSTLVGSLRYAPAFPRLFQNPFSIQLILLQIPLILSAVFAVNPELAYAPLDLYERVVVMSLLIPVLVQTVEELKYLILVVAGSLGFVGFKFGFFGFRFGGVQFDDGFAGFIGDSNGLALALAMATPLCWYSIRLVANPGFKLAYGVLTFGCIATVVMTFSRGCALTLAVVLLWMTFRSRHKLGILVMLAALSAPAILVMYDRYVPRISSIAQYEEDESAYARIVWARAALRMAKDYPLLGVGFGGYNYMQVASLYLGHETRHVVHNTYLQMLVDSGTFALAMYLALLLGAILWLGISVRRTRKAAPDLAVFPMAIQTSLVAFAIGSVFYSRVGFDLLYILLMAAAAWCRIARDLPTQASALSAPQPLEHAIQAPTPVAASSPVRLGRLLPGREGD